MENNLTIHDAEIVPQNGRICVLCGRLPMHGHDYELHTRIRSTLNASTSVPLVPSLPSRDPLTPYQAMDRLIALRQRLLDAQWPSCTEDAEALALSLRALRGLVQAMESVNGGAL